MLKEQIKALEARASNRQLSQTGTAAPRRTPPVLNTASLHGFLSNLELVRELVALDQHLGVRALASFLKTITVRFALSSHVINSFILKKP